MAITVDYSLTPFLITVPKADLTLETGTKYQLTVDVFWQLLRDYADSEEGIVQPVIYTRLPATASTPSITEVNDDYYSLEFEDGLYSVNIINGNTNIRDVEVKNQVSVNTNNTTGFIDPTFLQHGTYDGGVTIDTTSIYSGTEYPVGTPVAPVNNLADAHTIADAHSFDVIYVVGHLDLNTSDFSDGHTFQGVSPLTSTVTIFDPANISNCRFMDMFIDGVFDSNTVVERCIVGVSTAFSGYFFSCALEGPITLDGTGQTNIVNSWSSVAGGGAAQTPEIDMGGTGSGLTMRNYSGGIKLLNKTGIDATSIDILSGQIIFDSTVSAGDITVRGIAKITDNSTGTANIIDETVVGADPATVATAVWEKAVNGVVDGTFGEAAKQNAFQKHVHVDEAGGVAGTAYPLGTHLHPVNNIADATTIALANGISTIQIDEDCTFTGTDNIDGFVINGRHASKSQFTFTSGVSTVLTQFANCTMNGTMGGFITVRDSVIDDITGFEGILHQTMINGTVTCNGTQTAHILDCFSGIAGTGTPTIDMGGGGRGLALRNYNGGIKLENKTGTEDVSLDINSGQVILDGTVTNGHIVVRGIAKLTDNSTGATTIDDEALNEVSIVTAVWDYVKALTFQKFIGNN